MPRPSSISRRLWSRFVPLLLLALILPSNRLHSSETLHVAVASNFRTAFQALADTFASRTGIRALPSYGSTGKLHAQIRHGAPFHIFLSADTETPRRLHAAGLTAEAPFIYAIGKLVLWVPAGTLDNDMERAFRSGALSRIAMANPGVAPYGRAARQVLNRLDLRSPYADRMVYGENVGQVLTFVASGNAEAGFIARAQVPGGEMDKRGRIWQAPSDSHDPIAQSAVLLNNGKEHPHARRFITFITSDDARTRIAKLGYDVP
ncbi:MAG: molybdate ABC transporter substrate-binding protein [Magnetococcales bacterium]|nr:molybdate ABC transporter substrate-binding protein [Magnetococcales bacterium]